MSKVKILVPLNEFQQNATYRRKIVKIIKLENESSNMLNLQDDYPTILFGLRVEEKDDDDDGEVPPFSEA